jgi:hypothetical protein
MAALVNRLLTALRDKPMRFGYVVGALVLLVLLFTLSEFLPAPYDFAH